LSRSHPTSKRQNGAAGEPERGEMGRCGTETIEFTAKP
jgi:hypothetical protein